MSELTLRVTPDWDVVRGFWPVSTGFFAGQGLQEETVYALSMIAQELLENAVKYGHYPDDAHGIAVSLRVLKSEATVEVKSPAGPDDAPLRRLDDTIQWIRGFQSPFEAYMERLKAVAMSPPSGGASGLGLVRIAYEGQAVLDFYINPQYELAVSAVHRLPDGSPAGIPAAKADHQPGELAVNRA
ncbi:MAG: ATP-binding protein [Deltaproteobacteria bacterium]|nr:ATP-binding protein [Deltaproteobacteria bacterium]